MDDYAMGTGPRPLNVCLLTNDLGLAGKPRQVVDLARGLDKTSFRVVLVTLRPGEPLESDLYNEPGIRLFSVDAAGNWDLGAVKRLAALLEREGIEIIQTFGSPATAFGMLAARMAGTPAKVIADHLDQSDGGGALHRWMERRLARSADLFVSGSDSTMQRMVAARLPDDRLRLIYPGLSPRDSVCTPEERRAARAALNVRPDEPVVGTVWGAGNIDSFLLGASIVSRHVPSTRFVIAGEDPRSDRLHERIDELGLTRRAVFTGELRQPAPFIGAMDVAVEVEGEQREGSTFLVESMALARPIVAADTEKNRELFASGEAGLFVTAGDSVAMATAVLRVLTSPPLSAGFSERGRAIFERRFTQATMVDAYEGLYTELWLNKAAVSEDAERQTLEAR